jgi:hypothetical protein
MKNFVRRLLATRRQPNSAASPPGKRVKDPGRMQNAEADVHAVQSLVGVDAHRRRLAGGDPGLHQALGAIELTLACQLGRHVRSQVGE